MFSNLSALKKAGLFYVLVMALDVIQILIFRAVAPEARIVVFTHMATPLLMTLLMLFIFTRDGYGQHGRFGLGLRRLGWRAWGLALLLPLLVLVVSYGLGWLSGAAALSVPIDNGGLPDLLVNLIVNLLMSSMIVLWEEIGFRGYLQPKLMGLGAKNAVILSGFLHGIWHLPIIFLTPIYVDLGNPFLTIPIFLFLLTASGVLTGSLRLVTDSIWPGTILHGAFNAFLDIFIMFTVVSSPLATYLIGETGVLTLLATAVVALWMWQRGKTAVALIPTMRPAAESVK